MAHHTKHCEDCQQLLGRDWKEVHEWLDELFQTCGPSHRRHRHHIEGIEEVHRMWGDEAALAAKVHIIVDCWGIPSKNDYENEFVDAQGYAEGATQAEASAMLKAILQDSARHYEQKADAYKKEIEELQAALRENLPPPNESLDALKKHLQVALAFAKARNSARRH